METIRYFDSSVILSMLFNDQYSEQALDIWQRSGFKVSSRLLLVECSVVNYRQSMRLPEPLGQEWLLESSTWLKKTLDQVFIHEIDRSICKMVAEEKRFGMARSLDAIHLATAKSIADETQEFLLITFDKRMAALANELKIPCQL